MLNRVLCALGFVLLPLNVFGQGTLLWEVQENLNGNDVANAVFLSGKVAIVEGGNASGDVLRAFSRTKGTLQWDLGSLTTSPERVASHQKTLYVDDDTGLTAFDGSTGAVLWRALGACCAIVAGPTAVVTFTAIPHSATGAALRTTAYDASTGACLWDNHEGTDGFNFAYGPGAINQNRLVRAVGIGSLADPSETRWVIRTYDVASGALEWESSSLPANLELTKIVLATGRVVVAGSVQGTTYLAAFSAKTGAPLWENTAPETGRFTDIAVNASRLVGTIQKDPRQFVVQAYDVTTGALQWQDRPQGLLPFSQRVTAIDLNDRAVYVGGGFTQELFQFAEFMVRAYDAATGTPLWDDRSHRKIGDNRNSISDIQVGKNRLFVTGSALTDSFTTRDIIVRAYDIRSDGPILPPEGACAYTLEPSTQTVGPDGGIFTASVSVVESPPLRCAWRAVNEGAGPFIVLFGSTGSGATAAGTTSETITYAVVKNFPGGPERAALIRLEGIGAIGTVDQLLVTQEATPPVP